MQVRALGEADAGAYRQLRIAAIDECPDYACPHVVRELALQARRQSLLATYAEERGRVWGAFDAGKLVGAVAVSRDQAPGVAQVEAWGLYVMPAHRCKGLGAVMMLGVLRWCRQQPGIDRIVVHVARRNEQAVRWFARVGFKPCEQQADVPPQLQVLCWTLAPVTSGPARKRDAAREPVPV